MKIHFLAAGLLVSAVTAAGYLTAAPIVTRAGFTPNTTATASPQPNLVSYVPLVLGDGDGAPSTATPVTTPGTATPTSTPTNTPSPGPSPSPTSSPTPTPVGGTPLPFAWRDLAPVPLSVAEAQGSAVNGKFYVFGGFYNGQLQTTPQAHVYDPVTNTWKRLRDTPIKLTHSPIAVDGVYMYFVGGFLGDHPGNSITDVWRYDTRDDTWSQMPPLPEKLAAGGAVVLGRNLHAFSGTNRQKGNYNDKAGHYVLNLDTGTTWTALAPLPNPRNHIGSAVLDGKIYAIGGQKNGNEKDQNQSEVDVYDPATNTWSRAADLPEPRGHINSSVLAYQGRLIVIGGTVNGGENGLSSASVLTYDPGSNTWTRLVSLPGKRKTPIAGIIGNQLIVATGAFQGKDTDTAWVATLDAAWEQRAASEALAEEAGEPEVYSGSVYLCDFLGLPRNAQIDDLAAES